MGSAAGEIKNWERELEVWFEPFSEMLANKRRRHWAPVYLKGLLGPGERKSIEPIAERLAPGEHDQINHFVNQSRWETEPLGRLLVGKADALLGGEEAFLIIDDTALVKKGRASVGVAHQYCGELGKKANCQALVSLTLARGEVPVPIGLRLYMPKSWTEDKERRKHCGVPEDVVFEEKWRIALSEIDRVRKAGARFGAVLADVAYGTVEGFREGLIERGLSYAVGIAPNRIVYTPDVYTKNVYTDGSSAARRKGRPRKHGEPSVEGQSAASLIGGLGKRSWRRITWRTGKKGPLFARFCAVRIRMAEGEKVTHGKRLPGGPVQWLVCEERAGGERRYYLSNLPEETPLLDLARAIKARWSCEQAHQQMKEELGLDHYEGRSWLGLHHHALLSLIAFCFLQHLRLGGKKGRPRAQ